ncbi:hypothetical protein EJB05_09129, partial [Eragrostis curvula]
MGPAARSSGMKRCQTWSESDGETAAQRQASRKEVSAMAQDRHASGRSPYRVVVVSGWRSAAISSGQVNPPCQMK